MKERLAIDGGDKVWNKSFPAWPSYSREEKDAVLKVLESGRVNYWTGSECREFEREFAEFTGTKYAIALMNGTVALQGALSALDIGPGDDVIVTSRSFVASASVIVLQGANPVFADIDSDSQNVTADSIRAVLTLKTKAIIAVHLAGWPCDMDPIMQLAAEHDLKVIEDCAQAHGATYKGRKVGSIGHVAAFSFCQDKIITTGGEGGMVTTDSKETWNHIWSLKDHGKSFDAVYNMEHREGFRWLHESFGSNWRMTEMQAVIGRIQLAGLEESVALRRRNASILERGFSGISALRLPEVPEHFGHAFYKYYAFVRPEMLAPGRDRDRIMSAVNAEGVPCFSGSCSEIYLEKSVADAGMGPEKRLPIARELGETSLMFMVHPTLGEGEMQATVDAVRKVLSQAS